MHRSCALPVLAKKCRTMTLKVPNKKYVLAKRTQSERFVSPLL